jgi:hypothetical protein
LTSFVSMLIVSPQLGCEPLAWADAEPAPTESAAATITESPSIRMLCSFPQWTRGPQSMPRGLNAASEAANTAIVVTRAAARRAPSAQRAASRVMACSLPV